MTSAKCPCYSARRKLLNAANLIPVIFTLTSNNYIDNLVAMSIINQLFNVDDNDNKYVVSMYKTISFINNKE